MAMDWRSKRSSTALKLSPREIQRNVNFVLFQEKLDAEAFAFQKGIDAEDFVEEAILFLKSRGQVQWYHRCRRWGEVDLLGMDFLITFTVPAIVPLQVKNSETRKEEHIARYGDRIPCVVRHFFDDIEMMAGKILMASFPQFYEEEETSEESRPLGSYDVPPEESTFEIEDPQPEQFSPPSMDIMGEAIRKALPNENE